MRISDWSSDVCSSDLTLLCASHFSAGGGAVPHNPRLDEAIESCQAGAASVPQSLNSLTLLIVLKSLRGDVTQQDWDHFQQRLETVPMTRDNARIYMILTRSEEHTSELQSLMRISYAVSCLKKKKTKQ